VDQEPTFELLVLEPRQQVAALLLDPPIVWVIRGRAEKQLAGADVDERKTVCDSHAQRCDHALGEEVARDERAHVEPDELLPSRFTSFPPAHRRWRESLVLRNPPDRRTSELAAEDLDLSLEKTEAGVIQW